MPKEKSKIETSADLAEGGGGLVWEIIKTVGFLSVAIIVFRFYILQPFMVKGISMEPNFHENQYLVVNELAYNIGGGPQRGDTVVFKHPEPACTEFVNANYLNRIFFQGPCTNYIKRVIALPGETVTVRDGKILIANTKNPLGFVLDESYIVPGLQTYGSQTRTLGKNEYFVLGDNREPNASSDSREWGVLPRAYIVGKAWLVLYPFNEVGLVKRPSYNSF